MNYTHIALIPKKNEPQYMSNFCLISLKNVILDAQNAFVPSRQITDNTIVAFEVLHRMRNKGKGKKWQMTIKLDNSKGYDQVE